MNVNARGVSQSVRCRWCNEWFKRRRGGSPQSFCCRRHRQAYHTQCRRFAEQALESGLITIEDLKRGPTPQNVPKQACTLPEPPQNRQESHEEDLQPISDDLWLRLREIQFHVTIGRSGIAGLITLGYLAPYNHNHGASIREALGELVEAAMDAYIRPARYRAGRMRDDAARAT